MIHEVLRLTRPLIVPDCECTGTNPEQDRIVELGFQRWESAGLTMEWRSLINPGIPIPPHSTAIHHITDEMMKGCALCGLIGCDCFKPIPYFSQIAKSLASGFSACDFAGKNVRFDLRIIAAEMRRAGVEWSYKDARIVDIDRLEALAIPRNLEAMYRKYTGQILEGAHGALQDVRASVTVIERQLTEHTSLPRDLDAIHAASWPGWIDSEGKFRYENGVPVIAFGKYRGTEMKKIDAGYWKWIIGGDFSPEIKDIAGAALFGVYPEVKSGKTDHETATPSAHHDHGEEGSTVPGM